MQSLSPKHEKIKSYILDKSAYSIHDRGVALVQAGNIKECAKTGRQITGIVTDEDDEDFSVSFNVESRTSIRAHCDCSSDQEMEEQWCAHAVALLIQANELDFLDSESGFAPGESRYRMNSKSPVEIASMMREISEVETKPQNSAYRPEVKIFLDASEDRLGIQVLFNDEIQTQTLFDGFELQSERSLDSILLQILDDEGNWDEFQQLWYLNSSKSIERTLGLIQEYKHIYALGTKDSIRFDRTALKAKLRIEWHETSAELVMFWRLPDGSEVLKSTELLGTGPYWVLLDQVLYKISPDAARIASIFPYSSTITLSRAQVGPILEVINEGLFDKSLIDVVNPKLQPDSTVKDPKPILDLERKEIYQEQFATGDRFVIRGNLEFQYPQPPEDKNIVYLPNREQEYGYTDFLKSLGFEYESNSKSYELSGDAALDLVYKGKESFPRPWQVSGLEQIKKGLRFAELDINVTLTSSTPPKSSSKAYGIDWFDCHISLTQNSANVPLSLLFKNTKPDHDKWIKLDSGAYAMVPGGGLRQLQTSLGMLAPNFKLSNTIKTKLNSGQAISFARTNDPKVHIDSDKKLKALAKKLAEFDSIDKITPSKSFEGELRPYQSDGLSWLNFL
ncbi:MAG: hypothetical protein KDD62_08830, partial [Bdellovibrionales bacterium]|nr:hypothetical protein [Bdellovibrionales bacterium]